MATDSSSIASCWRDVRPPVTIPAPSKWTPIFSNSSFDHQEQQKYAEVIDALKHEARGILMAATTPLQQMILIDTLERLGLAYHFETEIEQILQQINTNAQHQVLQDYDLFTTALQFRLIRQHQHQISCNVFEKFVDKDGKFEETLSSDAEGLLSLYEAAHVRFHDEEILEEAARFSIHHLKRMEAELESPLKEKVKRALEHPLHRDIPIIYARLFISSIYVKDPSRDELLLKLAKFNFNFLQNLYKEELFQVYSWWNKLDMKSKLPYARDPVVEGYIWGVGYHYEPQYSYVRTSLAKIFQVITHMDDTYDNYATVNEAQLFTQVMDRWNADEVDRLPDYMKILYHFIMSACEDYERDAVKHGKGFAIPYFKDVVQQLARAYNQDLKWVMERQLPSFQDYLKNSEKTGCIYSLFATIIPGMKSVTQETIDWLKSEPKLGTSAVHLGRYANDICSYQRENKEGKVFTALDWYMKQHGVSKEETVSKFAELIEEAWKDINKEWVTTTFVPKETTVTFLSYARMCNACYNINRGDDGYTYPETFKADITALFLDPIR